MVILKIFTTYLDHKTELFCRLHSTTWFISLLLWLNGNNNKDKYSLSQHAIIFDNKI